ncbi:hypothetical protein [Paraburkholderia sp. A1RO-5L]|uniref:hypothetical protein n=1 Tax=unclassified Paraburkholderia TaxID=2615204 RepID=UPI003B7802EA
MREHTLCVSCFNREAEIARNRNAKGRPPQKWPALLHRAHVRLRCDGQLRDLDFGLATSVHEVIEAAKRRWPDSVLVGAWLDADDPPTPNSSEPGHRSANGVPVSF